MSVLLLRTGVVMKAYHANTLLHVIHSVRGIRPGLNNYCSAFGQLEATNLLLNTSIAQARLSDLLHVGGVDIRILAREVLLGFDPVLIEVDEQLEELMLTVFIL